MQGQVGRLVVDSRELLHWGAGGVGPKPHLSTYPLCALLSDGPLSHLVAQPNLKLRAGQRRLAVQRMRDEELSAGLRQRVRGCFRHEGWRGKYELKLPKLLQLVTKSLKGENRKRCCCDSEL